MKRNLLIILILLVMASLMARTSIYGTGRGASHDEAFAEAQVQIAQQISVHVEAGSEFTSLDIEADGEAFYMQSIEKSTRLTVDRIIIGIEEISSIERNGIFEVEAMLKISTLVNTLKGELDQSKSSAMALINGAKALQKEGKPLLAIKNYGEAQAFIPDFYAKKAIHDAFADYNYPASEELSISAIETAMRSLISRIGFEVISGDRQVAPNGSNLPEPVIFGVFYRDDQDMRIPVSSYPVKISYGDGSLLEKGVTNSEGNYPVFAKALALPDAKKIVCNSDATMLPGYLARILNLNMAVAYYEVQASQQIEVAIIVVDEKGNRLENLERSVAKALSGSKFVVASHADLELSGRVITENVQIQEGMGSPQYVAKVRLDLQLKRRSSSRSLGSFSADGTGLSPKSESEAIKNASGKVNINSRKLVSSISEYLDTEM